MQEGMEDHNLVHQVKAETISWKVYIPVVFEVLSILGALAFGYTYKLLLDGAVHLPTLLTVLGLYLAFSGLLTVLSRYFVRRMGVVALESAAVLLPFLSNPITSLVLIFILLFIFSAWGIWRTKEEMHGSVRIRFTWSSHLHLKKLISGLTLAVILLYLPQWSAKSIFFSEKTVERSFAPASGLVSRLYPELQITPTSTLETLAQGIVLSRLERSPIFNDLPPAARELAIQESIREFTSTLRRSLGEDVSEKDPIHTAFYKSAVSRFGDWRERFGNGFMLLWAVVMFFLIRSVGALISWISLVIGYLIYQSLFLLKVLRLGEEHRAVETIEFI